MSSTKRRDHARGFGQGKPEPLPLTGLPDEDAWEAATAFDRADVLLVDYDLFAFNRDEYLTGAMVAYMARCYSGCGVIVGVNELGPNPFDLTLIDNTDSFADLTIGDVQIDNRGLWFGITDDPQPGRFRPWSWPALLDAAERQARRSNDWRAGHRERSRARGAPPTCRVPSGAARWHSPAAEHRPRVVVDSLVLHVRSILSPRRAKVKRAPQAKGPKTRTSARCSVVRHAGWSRSRRREPVIDTLEQGQRPVRRGFHRSGYPGSQPLAGERAVSQGPRE